VEAIRKAQDNIWKRKFKKELLAGAKREAQSKAVPKLQATPKSQDEPRAVTVPKAEGKGTGVYIPKPAPRVKEGSSQSSRPSGLKLVDATLTNFDAGEGVRKPWQCGNYCEHSRLQRMKEISTCSHRGLCQKKQGHEGDCRCENRRNFIKIDKIQQTQKKPDQDDWAKLKQLKETSSERKKVGVNGQGTVILKEGIRRSETAQEDKQ